MSTPYLASGVFYLGAADGSGPLLDVGNSTELSLSHQYDNRPLPNYKSGGLLSNRGRLVSVTLNWRVMDRNHANLQRAIQGTGQQSAATGVTDEPHTAYLGGFIALGGLPDRSQAMTVQVGGSETTRDVDWHPKPGGLYIPVTSSIADGAAILVSYTRLPTATAEAFEDTEKRLFRGVFSGVNDAGGGDTVIQVPQLELNPADILTLIDDEAAGLPMTGTAVALLTRPPGTSQFYTVLNEDTP